jgi:Lon protease-like protein
VTNLLERVQGATGAMKVFPLPSAVLFPGTALPLHLFEPRYRHLIADCLATDKVMALAQLQPGWEPDYQGRPPMKPICCAGVVAWHEGLPDGRTNIIVQGVGRARILEEVEHAVPYRVVRVQLLPDQPYDGPEDEALRRALLDVAGKISGEASGALLEMAAHVRGGALADVVAAALVPDVERRQELLAELDVPERLRAVLEDVGELAARLGPSRPTGPLN